MGVFTIPNRPANTDTRDVTLIEADFDFITQNMDKGVAERKLLWRMNTAIGPGFAMSGQSFMFATGAGVASVGSNWVGTNLNFIHLSGGDYQSYSGKSVEFFMKLLAVCGVTPAITFTLSLYPASISGAVSGITPAIGALVAGSPVTAAPATNSFAKGDGSGSAFAYPGDGIYLPILQGSGTTAANSQTIIDAEMWWTYV